MFFLFQQYTLIGMVIGSLVLQFVVAIAFTSSTEKDHNRSKTAGDNEGGEASIYRRAHDVRAERDIIECDDPNPFLLDRSNPTVNKLAYVCILFIFILNFIIQLLDQIWMP